MKRSPAGFIAALVLGACALPIAACRQPAASEGPPMLVDRSGLVEIPPGSPLRARLVVQPVSAAAGARRLALPAVVEADPARTINILAPLTGRVAELDVDLGDHVRRGQVLAIIASGDLAQASSDVEKAKDAYALAEKALARSRGVQAAG